MKLKNTAELNFEMWYLAVTEGRKNASDMEMYKKRALKWLTSLLFAEASNTPPPISVFCYKVCVSASTPLPFGDTVEKIYLM